MPTNNKITNWYALKVFNNRLIQMQETIQKEAEGCENNACNVEIYIAMTEVDRALPQKPGKNTLVSYSGEQMAKNLTSKCDIIRIANKKLTVVTYKKPLVPSLMFIHCTESFLKTLKHNHLSEFSYYTRYADKELTEKGITEEAENTNNKTKKTELQKVPAIIPDDQMQAFIWLTSEDHEISYLGEPKDIKLGDRVRVTEGPFKGFVGNIKRIKKDRKFIITIGSIAAFTIEGITHKMVEKIET